MLQLSICKSYQSEQKNGGAFPFLEIIHAQNSLLKEKQKESRARTLKEHDYSWIKSLTSNLSNYINFNKLFLKLATAFF